MTEEVEKRQDQNDIVQMVYHTDARVTAMEGQLHDLSAGVSRIEQYLLNKPPVNVLGWVTAAGGGLIMLTGLLYGMAQYVDMQIEPLEKQNAVLVEEVDELEEFQHQTHYEMGRIHQWQEDVAYWGYSRPSQSP